LSNSVTKTRIAPTPSGYLHKGNAFSFSLTYLLARQAGHKILLRIDDADQARYRTAYANSIFKTLEALGIDWDEGPFSVQALENKWSQAKRKELYQTYLNRLAEASEIFACTCSRKQLQEQDATGYSGNCLFKNLPLNTKRAAWRIKDLPEQLLMFGLKGDAHLKALPKEMRHFVVKQKNGQAAYQLSSVADDVHFGITHIIRGQDLKASSLAQISLSQKLALPFNQVRFYHHDLLRQNFGIKLSKTQKAPAVLEQLSTISGKLNFFKKLGSWLGFKNKYTDLQSMLKALQQRKESLML
jgi:glutamyl-tRNA synthetase